MSVDPKAIPDLKKMSPEDIARALKLLENEKAYKEKVKAGLVKGAPKVSEMSKEQYAAYQKASRVASIRQTMRLAKFAAMVKAGTAKDPSDAEIQAEIKRRFPEKKA